MGKEAEERLNLGNDESERTQAAATAPRWPSRSDQPHHWLLPGIRRTVGGTGSTPSPAGEYPSLGRRPAPGSGPAPTVSATCRAPAASGRRWTPPAFAPAPPPTCAFRNGPPPGRSWSYGGPGWNAMTSEGFGLELGELGRSPDQIAPGRGKKPAPTPRIGVRVASNVAC